MPRSVASESAAITSAARTRSPPGNPSGTLRHYANPRNQREYWARSADDTFLGVIGRRLRLTAPHPALLCPSAAQAIASLARRPAQAQDQPPHHR